MGFKKTLFILSAVSVLGLTACSTVKISNYPQRQLMTAKHATAADIENNIRLSVGQNARTGWVVEQADQTRVVAGLTRRSHYLQVTYLISGNQVSSQITGSRNLDQRGNKIHKNAMAWKTRLDNSVFTQLSKTLN